MPRWKAGNDVSILKYAYTDDAYIFVGALLSLLFPDSLVWFSTREDFGLSIRSAQGGGCIFTLDCSTSVGGYTRDDEVSQFPVYTMDIKKGIPWLKESGFDPKIHLPWNYN
jgi:hypothetical protein